MSLQVFLQAQLLGTEDFMTTPSLGVQDSTADLLGRCAWLTLFCEVLPRALLAELKLSRMLLGSSSAEQFLLVLAEEDVQRADEFLARAAEAVAQISYSALRLVWSSTENLGAWPIVRKRIEDALLAKISAPAASALDIQQFFAPFWANTALAEIPPRPNSWFASFGQQLPTATKVGWSPESPAHLIWDGGQYSWALKDDSGSDDDGILFPRRFAMDENGAQPVSLAGLARRAEGKPHWGILRGDIDQFDSQLRRLGSIEEHIHLSVVFKEFFAGELALLCTMPSFWRKTTILYRGGDDFAVLGSWDGLIALAREIQRLFEKFMEQNLHGLPSLEAKTISMALALAPHDDTAPSAAFAEAGIQLRAAKATEPGTFFLFGRSLDWKRLSDADELKTILVRLVRDYGYAPEYIADLAAVYRESVAASMFRRNKPVRIDKPWRTYMRLSTIVPQARTREVNNLRTLVITNLIGKKTTGMKLRPAARIALDWARLAAGE